MLCLQGPLKCQGSCKQPGDTAAGCFECHEPGEDEDVNIAMDLSNARSPPAVELVPTFTTGNRRICLLLATGEMGKLRIEDAERLQVRSIVSHLHLQPASKSVLLLLFACLDIGIC